MRFMPRPRIPLRPSGLLAHAGLPSQVVLLLLVRGLWPGVDWFATLQGGLEDALHQVPGRG